MLFGNSGLPGAAIPAGADHGLGCRRIPGMVHAGPSSGEGRRIPVREIEHTPPVHFILLRFWSDSAVNRGPSF